MIMLSTGSLKAITTAQVFMHNDLCFGRPVCTCIRLTPASVRALVDAPDLTAVCALARTLAALANSPSATVTTPSCTASTTCPLHGPRAQADAWRG